MKATQQDTEKYLSMIAGTPQQIARAVRSLDDAQLHFKSETKSWSASDILAHLRACADLWTHTIYAMLAENVPVFSDIDERKWAKATRYAELAFEDSLQVFSLQRGNLVRVLNALPFEAWERSAIIFERKHTVFSQTRRLAKHETEHIEQLQLVLRS